MPVFLLIRRERQYQFHKAALEEFTTYCLLQDGKRQKVASVASAFWRDDAVSIHVIAHRAFQL